MGQSLHADAQIFSSSLFFINPTFCIESGVRLFQGRFCVYATVINEDPEAHTKSVKPYTNSQPLPQFPIS